jgi:serine/threonine protein kinase
VFTLASPEAAAVARGINMDAEAVQAEQPQMAGRVTTLEVVTPNYRSPEVGIAAYMDQPGLHGKVDVWSVGCVFVELLGMRAGGRRQLLVGSNPQGIINHWRGLPPDAAPNRATAFADLLSSACGYVEPSALDLVESMLRHEPRSRISTEQSLLHAYFTGAGAGASAGEEEGVFAFIPERLTRQATPPPEALDAREEDGLERHNNLMLSIVDELLHFLP